MTWQGTLGQQRYSIVSLTTQDKHSKMSICLSNASEIQTVASTKTILGIVIQGAIMHEQFTLFTL